MLRSILTACLLLTASFAAGAAGFLDKAQHEPQFLPVDEAFEIQPLEIHDGKLDVRWRIARGYYLYRQRLSFDVLFPKGDQVGKPQLPKGESHQDEYFGDMEIYRGGDFLTAELPLKGAPPKSIKVKVGYQGCADAGLCYPPQERVLELSP